MMPIIGERCHLSKIVSNKGLCEIPWDHWDIVYDKDEECMMLEYTGGE